MGSWESCAAWDGACGPLLSRGTAPQHGAAGAHLLPHRARSLGPDGGRGCLGAYSRAQAAGAGMAKPIKSRQWSDLILQQLPEERKELSAQGWSPLSAKWLPPGEQESPGRAAVPCAVRYCPRGGEMAPSGLCACLNTSQETWEALWGGMYGSGVAEGGLPFPGAYPRASVFVVPL